MATDIIISCRRDPSVLTGEPYRSCEIAKLEVEDRRVILECRPITVELVFEYAELIARTFDGTIMSGSELVEPTDTDPLALADLEAEWCDLDAAIDLDLEATLAVTTRRRIAWEAARLPAFTPK